MKQNTKQQYRLIYHRLHDAVWSSGTVRLPAVPPGVPVNLQTSQQRALAYNEYPNILWARTWYGNENIDRAQADEAYEKLCDHVGEVKEEFIRGNWAFGDEDLLADRVGAPTLTGSTPPYVKALFGCYPDMLETGGGLRSGDEAYIQGGQGVGKQHIMLIVADKRACQTGAVLLLGIDDFGQMTPG